MLSIIKKNGLSHLKIKKNNSDKNHTFLLSHSSNFLVQNNKKRKYSDGTFWPLSFMSVKYLSVIKLMRLNELDGCLNPFKIGYLQR